MHHCFTKWEKSDLSRAAIRYCKSAQATGSCFGPSPWQKLEHALRSTATFKTSLERVSATSLRSTSIGHSYSSPRSWVSCAEPTSPPCRSSCPPTISAWHFHAASEAGWPGKHVSGGGH